MLDESFIFLPGVREKTERKLWCAGIHTWEHLLTASSVTGVGTSRLLFWKTILRDLDRKTVSARLGTRYAWRAYKLLMDNPRFIDIETTERGDITVLGISDGDFYHGFVRGQNLERTAVARACAGATCLVTFNGASFDLPIIKRQFPGVLPTIPHLDLRHICAQAGLRGGLKRIEEHLAIRRASMIRDVNGADAIFLWHSHLLGNTEALQELVEYNAADVLNLAPLLDLVVPALWQYVRYNTPLPFSRIDLNTSTYHR